MLSSTPAPTPFSLAGKRILVTGAAGGIGLAVVRLAMSMGAQVVAADRAGAPFPAELAGSVHPFDLADVSATESAVAALTAEGPLDALIHTAAVLRRTSDLDAVTEEDWDIQHDVNLKGTFFLTRAVANSMRGRGGSIVAFSSQGWWTGGFGGSAVYNASKGGIVTLVRGLARTYAADGVRINAVAPGAVDTAMMRDGLDDAFRAQFISQIPLGRMADPSEVAAAALFLATDAASYMTGATLNVSGGQLMY